MTDEATALILGMLDGRPTRLEIARLDAMACSSQAVRRAFLKHHDLDRSLHTLARSRWPDPASGGDHVNVAEDEDDDAGDAGRLALNDLSSAMVLPALTDDDESGGNRAGDYWDGRVPKPSATVIAPSRRRWVPLAIAATVLTPILVGVGIIVGMANRSNDRPAVQATVVRPAPSLEPSPPATFKLAAAIEADARLTDGRQLSVGDVLPTDPIELRAGWLRLDCGNGATAVLESPARLRFVSAFELELISGRLTAVVPPTAHGFSVTGPACRVIDLGTEFGMAVRPGGGSDVAVFRGSVAVTEPTPPPDRAGPAWSSATTRAEPHLLFENQGCQLTGAFARPVVTSIHPGDFVRVGQFDRWAAAAAATASAAEVARAAAERLCRDPSLAVYYSFADRDEAGGRTVIANRASANAGRFNLTLSGPNAPDWTLGGRFPGWSAIDFSPARASQLLVDPYPVSTTGNLTLAAWVNARSRPPWASIAKSRGHDRTGQFALGLKGSDGDLVARVFQANGTDVEVREGAKSPLPIGQWVHVALVCDGTQARLYRNGEQVAAAPCGPVTANPDLRTMAIGFRTADDGRSTGDPLEHEVWDGQIDSIALFHRPLTPVEVHDLWSAVRKN